MTSKEFFKAVFVQVNNVSDCNVVFKQMMDELCEAVNKRTSEISKGEISKAESKAKKAATNIGKKAIMESAQEKAKAAAKEVAKSISEAKNKAKTESKPTTKPSAKSAKNVKSEKSEVKTTTKEAKTETKAEVKSDVKQIKISAAKLNKLDFKYVDYNEKSFAIIGEGTREIKAELKKLSGRFNPALKVDGKKVAGWIFAKRNMAPVLKSLKIA